MARARTESILTRRTGATSGGRRPDQLLVEEPMAIHLDDALVATTIRTPGHDFELAVGFCHSEGLLAGAPVTGIRYCATGPAFGTDFNVVTVDTGGRAPEPTPRLGSISSSCGLCGAEAIAELVERLPALPPHKPWPLELLVGATEALTANQPLFAATGGAHGAIALDRAGSVVVGREDIGRHNAVDKVVGRLLLDQALPARDLALIVSGRGSFEMVQKAWAAGFTALVAVSAPSSLAVSTARRAGMTLVAFIRDGVGNIYSPEQLI